MNHRHLTDTMQYQLYHSKLLLFYPSRLKVKFAQEPVWERCVHCTFLQSNYFQGIDCHVVSHRISVRLFVERLIAEWIRRTSSKIWADDLYKCSLSHSLTLAKFEWLIDFNWSYSSVLKRVNLWKCYISPFRVKLCKCLKSTTYQI